MLKNVKGENIGYYSLRSDRKGGVRPYIMGINMQKIELSTADLIHNEICPDCKHKKLYHGVGTNGEPFITCEACGFFSE